MTSYPSPLEMLNGCKFLDLVRYGEAPEYLDLRVLVHEARVQPDPVPIDSGNSDVDRVFAGARPILTKPGYFAFTITFENYIAFGIRNEIYALPEKHEDFQKVLRTYDTSAFLDYVQKSTSATPNHPGPFTHYALICSDHVFDVICQDKPVVTHALITPEDLQANN